MDFIILLNGIQSSLRPLSSQICYGANGEDLNSRPAAYWSYIQELHLLKNLLMYEGGCTTPVLR